jgi:hypothetical protein
MGDLVGRQRSSSVFNVGVVHCRGQTPRMPRQHLCICTDALLTRQRNSIGVA